MVQNKLVTLFSSYDVFGKSLPGAVFFLGFISILPQDSTLFIELTNWSEMPAGNFVVVLILALGLGLIFGEAIHTLANVSERLVAWLGRRAINLAGFVRDNLPGLHNLLTSDFADYADATEFEERMYITIDNSKYWYKKRYYGLNSSFKSHRRLFAERCVTNFGDKRGPRQDKAPKKIYSEFSKAFEEVFDNDLPKNDISELMNLYPLITAEATKSGGSEFRRFQSVYSFCRSMWVTLLIFSIIHLAIYASSNYGLSPLLDFQSVATIFVPEQLAEIIPVTLFIGSALFVIASGTYKERYVEYLVAEFSLYATDQSSNGADKDERGAVGQPEESM